MGLTVKEAEKFAMELDAFLNNKNVKIEVAESEFHASYGVAVVLTAVEPGDEGLSKLASAAHKLFEKGNTLVHVYAGGMGEFTSKPCLIVFKRNSAPSFDYSATYCLSSLKGETIMPNTPQKAWSKVYTTPENIHKYMTHHRSSES